MKQKSYIFILPKYCVINYGQRQGLYASATQKEFVEVLLRLRVIIYTILSVLVG